MKAPFCLVLAAAGALCAARLFAEMCVRCGIFAVDNAFVKAALKRPPKFG